jgi:hypothetical protein
MKYIFHHLGLGDHIICNGMVRHFKEVYGEVTVFCKPQYFQNVEYMYRDDNKINVLQIGEHSDIEEYIKKNNLKDDTIIVWYREKKGKSFDECFYDLVNIPFEYRFTKFNFVRNQKKEEEVYNELNPSGQPYIYVHDDLSRGYGIDRNKIVSNLNIIENNEKFLLFDMLKIIENAEEIHVMQTSMKELISSYFLDKPKIFLHWYVRNYNEDYKTTGLNETIYIY